MVALKGTLPAPKRTVDTNLLTSWLTLRAVEQQSRQIDAMEQAAREAAAAAAAAAPPSAESRRTRRSCRAAAVFPKARSAAAGAGAQCDQCGCQGKLSAGFAAAGHDPGGAEAARRAARRHVAPASRRGRRLPPATRLAELTSPPAFRSGRASPQAPERNGVDCDNDRARTAGSPTTDCRAGDRCRWTKQDRTGSRSRSSAISFRPFQNASSRLTLVLWPAITMERLITGDFIDGLLFRFDADREFGGPCHGPPPFGRAPIWRRHGRAAVRRRCASALLRAARLRAIRRLTISAMSELDFCRMHDGEPQYRPQHSAPITPIRWRAVAGRLTRPKCSDTVIWARHG